MKRIRVKNDILSGFVTGLFSIPEGMAYAKLAGVDPAFGLYSGIVPTISASMTTGTVLMVSTLTSAIAISTRSVIEIAGLSSYHDMAIVLSTLTFIIGLFMFVLGILRMGSLVNFVCNSVMTGFVIGACALIIIGELDDLVGYVGTKGNKLEKLIAWITHVKDWDLTTLSVGFSALSLMLFLQWIRPLKEAASVITLFLMSGIVYIFHFKVKLIGDIATIPSQLPQFVLPDVKLMPQLLLGGLSVALVALIQGASINNAVPNPDGSRADFSRDFLGQAVGNLTGAFFQSMGTGGSLSRTGISVGSGAKSRFSALFSGCWVALFIWAVGKFAELVPLSVISGILCVVAGKIILSKTPDMLLIIRSSAISGLLMGVTFASALIIPLQWTIFLGAGLSYVYYLYTSATQFNLYQIVKNKEGYFEEKPLPKKYPSNQATVIEFVGNRFFAEVPSLEKYLPSHEKTKNAVIIWRMRGRDDAHSTFLKWLKRYASQLKQGGNHLMLEGVKPHFMNQLKCTGLADTLGEKKYF